MSASENPHAGADRGRTAVQTADRARSTSSRFGWLRLFLFLAIVFIAPAVLLRFDGGNEFDQASLQQLNQLRPEFAFLGNSMLETRIDPDYLTDLLDGRTAVSLALSGSQSAIWYLQLKNLVAASDTPPQTVFVFFRNDLITRPLEALEGRNRETIESLLKDDDTQFDEVLKASRSNHQKAVAVLQDIYPLQHRGPAALDGLSELAALPFPSSRSQLSSRSDDAFAFYNLQEPADREPPPEAVRPFADAVSSSFLPPMLDAAREWGIRLVFVRVQTRPNDDGSLRETESMGDYSADLAYYLQARGVGYVDFTGNPAVGAGLYYDSFHIRQRYLPDYTELFFLEMSAEFEDPGNEGGQGG